MPFADPQFAPDVLLTLNRNYERDKLVGKLLLNGLPC